MKVTGHMVIFRWNETKRIDAAGFYPTAAEAYRFGESVGKVFAVKPVEIEYEPGQIPAEAHDKGGAQFEQPKR